MHATDTAQTNAPSKRLLISAFGIHMGGGMVLLDALITEAGAQTRSALIDARASSAALSRMGTTEITRVARTFRARILSLRSLAARAQSGDVLLCFNSLPPLRPSKAYVVTYVHAPHFVGAHAGVRYAPLTALRLRIERAWFRWGVRFSNEVWVQTDSMVAAMRHLHPAAKVHRVALVDEALFEGLRLNLADPQLAVGDGSQFVFFYPADGVGHKNHGRLLQAWSMLAEQGLRPKLILTLTTAEMLALRDHCAVDLSTLPAVSTLGRMPRNAVLEQMRNSHALIFPSLAETLGLPLLEARVLGTPIVASERDFVRDVCAPQQTFDPESARSIALAVRRFITGTPLPETPFYSAQQFIARLLSCGS